MIYIPIKHIKPKMVLARDVSFVTARYPLLVQGQQMSMSTIEKLADYNVPGVYIESKTSDDIVVEDFFDNDTKREIVGGLKGIFDDFATKKSISLATNQAVTKIAEKLVTVALSKNECLFNVADIKDYDGYTYTHSMYVGTLAVLLGMQLGYSDKMLVDLATSGLLHDVGKVDIPSEIVNKPARLTTEEFDIMKTHPDNAVLRFTHFCQISAQSLTGIATHHEKFDGTGYPYKLSGKDIPLFGRILALADVYDALTSERSYRKACPSNEAIEYMLGNGNQHFDYDLLQYFLKTVAVYPTGSIVKMSNGYYALIVENSQTDVLRPKIRLLYPSNVAGEEIDLKDDKNFLSVTIKGVADDDDLPDEVLGI